MNKYYNELNWALIWIPRAVILYAFYSMVIGGLYSYITIGPVSFHSWSALAIGLSYLYTRAKLQFLPIPLRDIYSYALIVAGMHLYDSVYSIFALASGHRWSVFPYVNLALTLGLLLLLESKNMFLEFRPRMLIGLIVLGWCFILLTNSGFYDAVLIYETSGGPDPNMNPIWLISKLAGFFVFPLALASGPHVKVVRWLLY